MNRSIALFHPCSSAAAPPIAKPRSPTTRIRSFAQGAGLSAMLAVFALVAGCGSGGDGGTPAPSPSPASTLEIQGTAATGAPIIAASVEVKCASGSGSGTTGSDGTFSVDVASGSLPCVLRVAPAGGTALHSVAYGAGDTVRANLTPATELIVASLASADPAAFYSSFDNTAAQGITGTAVASAQSFVVALLRAAGVDFSALGDLIGAPFTATAGNPYDAALVNLSTALTSSGTSLPVLTSSVVASSGAAASIIALPPDMLLRRAAASCSAMRSGDFHIVTPTPGAPLAQQWDKLTFDAATMTSTRSDGATATWSDNGGDCRFKAQGTSYGADVAVTQAGVIAGTLTRNGVTRTFFGVPVQTHTLADLAGTWNVIGLEYSSIDVAFLGSAGTTTLNDSGRYTGGINCRLDTTWAVNNCATVASAILALIPTITAEPDGGFAMTDITGMSSRLFVYRGGSGDLMVAVVSVNGTFAVYTPDKSIPLPTVGAVSKGWSYDANAQLVAYPVGEGSSTVISVDTAADTYTRVSRSNGGTRETTNTLSLNNPRRGYFHRPMSIVTASDGTQVQLNEYTAMRLHGIGLVPLLLPGPKTFELSVTRP
jgi:hypothetical protein